MRYPLGSPLIPYGTPLHVTELFLQVLKTTFADFPEDYPYRYIPGDYTASGVAFDVALNKDSNIYGKKPLIVVSRGAQTTSPQVIGDIAHVNLPRNVKFGTGLVSSSVNVAVSSRVKAEAEIVAQLVFGTMMLCRTHMPQLLGIHMVDAIQLTDVNRMDEDDAMFVANAMFQYTTQYVWKQTTIDAVLRGIGINLERVRGVRVPPRESAVPRDPIFN